MFFLLQAILIVFSKLYGKSQFLWF